MVHFFSLESPSHPMCCLPPTPGGGERPASQQTDEATRCCFWKCFCSSYPERWSGKAFQVWSMWFFIRLQAWSESSQRKSAQGSAAAWKPSCWSWPWCSRLTTLWRRGRWQYEEWTMPKLWCGDIFVAQLWTPAVWMLWGSIFWWADFENTHEKCSSELWQLSHMVLEYLQMARALWGSPQLKYVFLSVNKVQTFVMSHKLP